MKLIVSLVLPLIILLGEPAALCAQQSQTQVRGLKAQDINGFKLDMSIRDVAAHAPNALESWGDGYRAKVNDVEYDFGFSALGHLYRIDSTQSLGSFIPDRAFGLNLTNKLTSKYGPPQSNQLPDAPAWWTFYVYGVDNSGQAVRREAQSLSVSLGGGYGQPITLDMKLMDFRILWRDTAILNAKPKKKAQEQVHF